MKAKHLAFAKAHQHWTTEHWSTVLFSDESTIQQFAARKHNISKPKRNTIRSTLFQLRNTPKSNDLGNHVRQWVSWFVFFPPGTTMNCKKYLKWLKDKQKIYVAIDKSGVFMHDGAPCYRSRIVSDFLKVLQVKNWKFCSGLETAPT